MTKAKIYTCRCGELDGMEHCEWTGPADDLVVVEYMPIQHRASHEAAGNSGSWPANGSIRAAIQWECAELFEREYGDDSEWFRVIDAPVERFAESA